MWKELLKKRIIFVTGKGGTGKTTISSILSLLFSDLGKKTLFALANYNPPVLSLFPNYNFSFKIKEIKKDLYGINIDTVEGIKEFISIVLRSRLAVKFLFESKFGEELSSIIKVVPVVKEWTIIGKLTEHIEREDFDTIIVDSPSTGHFVDLIKVGDLIAKLTPDGFMKELAIKKSRYLRSSFSTIVITTVLESLAINETESLIEFLKRNGFNIQGIIVNKVLPFFIEERDIEELDLSLELKRFLLDKLKQRERQEQLLKRLEKIGLPLILLPYIVEDSFEVLLYRILKVFIC